MLAYASEYSMKFNADKSKCMAVLLICRRNHVPLLSKCIFNTGGTSMEIVTSYCHLRHTINSSLNDDQDILNRRWTFIGQVNSVLCYFGKLPSVVKAQLFRSYCTSFYGCVLRDLSCSIVDDFYIV